MPSSARLVCLPLTLLVATTATAVFAQSDKVETARTAPLVTASATGERVRFVAPVTSVVQIRVEVFASSGEKLFDSEFRRGNIIDWNATADGQKTASHQDNSVLFVVTVRTLSGQLRQRHGLASIQDGRVVLRRATREGLSLQQSQAWEMSRQTSALGSAEGETREGLAILTEAGAAAEQPAASVTAHDGQEGQLTSTTGALTFRTGDLFSAKEVERMRITEGGKIGIGTNNPQTALDVAGAVRASEGFRFRDGTTLTAENGKLSVTNSAGDNVLTPNAVGTGTVNRVAKWTETGGAGTLGNTQITETNGSVVVGTAGQTGKLQIFGTATQDVFAGMGPDVDTGPAFNYGYAGGTFGRSAGFFNVRPDVSAVAPNPSLRFMTANVLHMIITNTGNVGIGTTAPAAKLHVNGIVNFTGLRTETNATSPNVIGGHSTNAVTAGVYAATIGGGGGNGLPNRVTDTFGTVGGGVNNRAGDNAGFTFDSSYATVGGGTNNIASGQFSTVGGGIGNTASGYYSTVPGGDNNTAQGQWSFAAGRRAKALNQGSFVWADSTDADFSATAINQFLIRAGGGVGINTNLPTAMLHVAGNVNFTGLRTETTSGTPNILGGDSGNSVTVGVVGATIGGGGYTTGEDNYFNRVTDFLGTVGGGANNQAGDGAGTTGDKTSATVGGGFGNIANGPYATVPGGLYNTAQGEYSFAAGVGAQALHNGTFVWADSTGGIPTFFASTANNQFLIRAGGVGIGTNAPGYRLDVVGRSRIKQDAGQTGGTGSAGLWLFQNTPAADRAFVGMETDNSVGFYGNNGGGWGLIMNTQTGNVGIGTSAPDAKLSVNGQASKPGGGSWNVFSDERLKNIKGRFATGLNAVMKLKPLRYEYKSDNALELKSEGEYIGFSAQAVQKVIPEAVTKNAQGYLLVNNDPILWTMLNAIKEQQAQIERQQKLIDEQQRQLNDLKEIIKPSQSRKTRTKK